MVFKLGKLFRSFDRFGEAIQMNYKGETKFKTSCGAIATLIVYVLIFINTMNISLDFVNNENQKEISRRLKDDVKKLDQQNLQEMDFNIGLYNFINVPKEVGEFKFY